MFINHLFATTEELPSIGQYLYQYVVAGNGIFVRAARPGLEAMIPVQAAQINGLAPVAPYVRLAARVPQKLVVRALAWSVDALPKEVMFWFGLDQPQRLWTVHKPPQVQSRTSVYPLDAHHPFGATALIDMHSHNAMAPFFSRTDNKDETGFRVYAVIGSIHPGSAKPPRIRVRVGIYGHTWEIPAGWVFDLPKFLVDANSVQDEDEATDDN